MSEMVLIKSVIPAEPPDGWDYLPEFVDYKPPSASMPVATAAVIEKMRVGDKIRVWPENGVGYIYKYTGGRYDGRFSQLTISILGNNSLHASISDSTLGLSEDEAADLIAQILPDQDMTYIPQKKINEGFLQAGIKKRVLIGEGRAPIQHFTSQL